MEIIFQNYKVEIKAPNICPHCHITINPRYLHSQETLDTDDTPILITTWICTNDSCNKIFLAIFKEVDDNLIFARFLNGFPKGPDWPKPIIDLKDGDSINAAKPTETRFIKTYLQSLVAENEGLDEIAGMGFRKAIEYLVKDWAIKNKPEDKEKIKNAWLGEIIKTYYTGDLKDILERATWLGNDQAHYKKLFEEFDTTILKELIQLIMVELDRQHKMQHYIEKIQKIKK